MHFVVVAVRFKVVYTDYETAIVYRCHGVTDQGRCHRRLEQVDVLSRQPHLTDIDRSRLYDVIRQQLCVDVYDLVKSAVGQISQI